VYLRQAGNRAAIAALDPRTGAELWSTSPGVFPSWPAPCPDDLGAVCITAGGTLAQLRVHTAKPVKSVTFSASQGARQLGLGLYDAGIRDPETLIGVRRTTIAWRKTLADIFDLPGATTDWGWSIERVDGRGVFVGSVGWNPVSETGGKQVFDLARTETAGFRIRNGKV